MTRALITGITGQDGSYLAELLLAKGYEVHGLIRRASTFNTGRIEHVRERLHLHYGDIADGGALQRLVWEIQPDEVYHLAAMSHVRVSFETPEYTVDVTGTGTLRLLEAVRTAARRPRVYLAGSSEQFGAAPPPQNEETRFYPRSPYGCAKVLTYDLGRVYREAYGMFVVTGLLFNHTSERRGETFVSRKVTRAVGRIRAGLQQELLLGNLDVSRDWGYAPEYVDAMWRMLQVAHPIDYVIGTGESHTVREWVELAFAAAGLDWREHVKHDPKYLRPAEVEHLRADATRARKALGWESRTPFAGITRRLVDHDIKLAAGESAAREVAA